MGKGTCRLLSDGAYARMPSGCSPVSLCEKSFWQSEDDYGYRQNKAGSTVRVPVATDSRAQVTVLPLQSWTSPFNTAFRLGEVLVAPTALAVAIPCSLASVIKVASTVVAITSATSSPWTPTC